MIKRLTFITIMKKLLLFFSLIIAVGCTQAQIVNKQDITKIPPFKILRPDSTYFTPANLEKNKPVMIIYFSPDCSHCQKDIPALKKIYDEWKNKGVNVYAVDIEMEADKWKKFIHDHDLDWINVNDVNHTSNFRQTYDVYSTPTIYLLDDKKIIKGKRLDHSNVAGLIDMIERKEKDKAKDKDKGSSK